MKFRLHHVNIVVDDIEAATHFYTEILGLPIIDDRINPSAPGGHFAASEGQIHLTLGEAFPERGQHFALEVDDFEATIEELEANGGTVTRASDPCRKQAAIFDPAGNRIEIRAVEVWQ